MRLKHVSEFKYLGCGLDESGKDATECSRRSRVGGGLQVLLGLW